MPGTGDTPEGGAPGVCFRAVLFGEKREIGLNGRIGGVVTQELLEMCAGVREELPGRERERRNGALNIEQIKAVSTLIRLG